MGWILVTGAAKGLGREICLMLSRQKRDVLIHYNQSACEALLLRELCKKNGCAAEVIQGDFSTHDGVRDFIRRLGSEFGDVHSIVNNVGNFYRGATLAASQDLWQKLFQTNFYTPLHLIQSCVESIIRHKGKILNIGMVGLNSVRAGSGCSAYVATKQALLNLTKSLAKELASQGVCVNMVSPGYMTNSIELPRELSDIPVGRPAELCEVARVVVFLIDQDNKYITGQNIEVAGGVGL